MQSYHCSNEGRKEEAIIFSSKDQQLFPQKVRQSQLPTPAPTWPVTVGSGLEVSPGQGATEERSIAVAEKAEASLAPY